MGSSIGFSLEVGIPHYHLNLLLEKSYNRPAVNPLAHIFLLANVLSSANDTALLSRRNEP